jgi:hypothetical protein
MRRKFAIMALMTIMMVSSTVSITNVPTTVLVTAHILVTMRFAKPSLLNSLLLE